MQNKKGLLVALVLLVAILAVAGVAYASLGNTQQTTVPNIEASSAAAVTTDDSAAASDLPAIDATDENTTTATDETTEDTESAGPIQLAEFTVSDRDHNDVKLSSVYGKPALVGFWATWCPPCNAEAPTIQKLYEEYGDRVNFMMIDAASDGRDTFDDAYRWADESGYTYPIYVDETGEAIVAGQVYYLPTMYVLDAEGNVLTVFSGALDEDGGTQLLEQLIAY